MAVQLGEQWVAVAAMLLGPAASSHAAVHSTQRAAAHAVPALFRLPACLQKLGGFSDVRSPPLEGLDSHSERFQVRAAAWTSWQAGTM